MKRPASRTLIPALLFAALVVVTLNVTLAFRSLKGLVSSEHWVQHTWEVIYQVELILGSARDAETGTRGFIVTGKQEYLQPHTTAIAELPAELDKFGSLTLDNPSQGARLVEMRAILEQRLELLAQTIELRRNGDSESMHAIVLSGTGKAQMDHLRAVADSMEAEERRLLEIRKKQTSDAISRAQFSLGFASGLDLLLILLIFRYLARERGLRVNTEEAAERLAVANAAIAARADEVRQLNVTLEERVRQRTAELESTNRELEAFSYSVSHDLRSPLRTIDGFSLALEEDYADAVDATGRDYIRRVRTGVQRMGQLIDALLQLSRITRAEITREPVDVSAIAQTVVADIKEANLAQKAIGQEVIFKVEDGLKADADPKLLQVALENLIGNAVKFSSKVANPVVEFGWDDAHKAYFVRDNGAGFDMYYSEKLFNAFNRLHGDKDFKGSGIGLATVARVIRRHHGRIWAESAVDHGATFWFTLG
jgi:signal transduction histidine kinase